MKQLFFLTSFLFWGLFGMAQEKTVTGTITSAEDGLPVIGATILVKGTSTGTATDLDGQYSITVPDANTVLVISYTGLKTQEITVGDRTQIDVTLESSISVLDEVVITEYKVPLIEQDNTTSGAVITGESIRNLPTRNINALAATSAGLATADEGGAINVRGSRANATDYYIDGIRMSGGLLPESEIEQLQV